MVTDEVTLDVIRSARERIRDHVDLTPCRRSRVLSEQYGGDIFLKLDHLQLTGSFKERGAANKLAQLTDEERERGVIAASAGNHAQAVALHGSRLGISTRIVMPEGTPIVKVTRTRGFGGEVILHGENFDESYAHARALQRERGYTFVHPFEDPAIIAGQGTIGLEILEQVPDIDTVIVAIGGGGLAAGMGVAIKQQRPDVELIGVEPASLPSMTRALEHGSPIEVSEGKTLADGVAVRKVGALTSQLVSRYVDRIVTVSEREIASAILTLLEQEKTLAEGAGAASLAAVIAGEVDVVGKRVCALICGGNIDVNVISRIIERGLVATGRLHRISLRIKDTPGTLANVLTLLGKQKANVMEVYHNRVFNSGEAFGTTNIELKLETRGPEHIESLEAALAEAGYEFIEHL
jgi:threonine dehydratase